MDTPNSKSENFHPIGSCDLNIIAPRPYVLEYIDNNNENKKMCYYIKKYLFDDEKKRIYSYVFKKFGCKECAKRVVKFSQLTGDRSSDKYYMQFNDENDGLYTCNLEFIIKDCLENGLKNSDVVVIEENEDVLFGIKRCDAKNRQHYYVQMDSTYRSSPGVPNTKTIQKLVRRYSSYYYSESMISNLRNNSSILTSKFCNSKNYYFFENFDTDDDLKIILKAGIKYDKNNIPYCPFLHTLTKYVKDVHSKKKSDPPITSEVPEVPEVPEDLNDVAIVASFCLSPRVIFFICGVAVGIYMNYTCNLFS